MNDAGVKKRVITIVRETILGHSLIGKGEGALVAVSGGPDSMALLHILSELKNELGIWLAVAHLDHRLRPESADEADFVEECAHKLGAPFRRESEDIHKLATEKGVSLEEAGRIARYRFLQETAQAVNAVRIATGHHADDSVETFLLRLLRGSSLTGLGGIRPLFDNIIRPLIALSRREIMAYIKSERIPYVIDPTNLEKSTDRNFVRNRLIPVTRERFPQFEAPLLRTIDLVAEEEDLLENMSDELYAESVRRVDQAVEINLLRLSGAHRALKARVIVKAYYAVSDPQARLTRTHVDKALDVAFGPNPSAVLSLPASITMEREYDKLFLYKGSRDFEIPSFAYTVSGPSTLEIKETGARIGFRYVDPRGRRMTDDMNRRTALFDAELVTFPLSVRSIRPGDRMRPWGMEGSRKLKDILIANKTPKKLRKAVALVVKNTTILWTVGIRRSDEAPVNSDAERALEIRLL